MIDFTITLREKGVPRQLAKKMNTQIIKGTMEEVGRYWHRHIFPRHFEPGADARYGYRPRARAWKERKRRITGEDIDLVYKGAMRDAMTHFRRITGTAKRYRVIMQGPTYVYYHNKAREVTRITPAEEMELKRVAERAMQQKLDEALKSMPTETTQIG